MVHDGSGSTMTFKQVRESPGGAGGGAEAGGEPVCQSTAPGVGSRLVPSRPPGSSRIYLRFQLSGFGLRPRNLFPKPAPSLAPLPRQAD